FRIFAYSNSRLSVSYNSSNTSVATISGNTVTIVGPGTTSITANQAGNSTYNAANPVGQTLSVAVKNLTVSGASAQNKIYDGNTIASITGATLNGIVGSDNVTVSGGGTFTSANAGTGIAVTANLSLSGTHASNYSLTQPTGLSADITKASQSINFPALAAKNSTDAPFSLSATATSGLSVTFASLDTNMLKISGTTATIASYGTVTIAATQLGNNNYDSATTVYQTLTINRVASTIAAWEVNGLSNYGPSPFTPSTSDTNLTITGLTRGNGFNTSGTAVGNTFGGTTVSGSTSNSLATAISTNTFFFFNVTPKANRKVSFNRIDTMNIRRSGTAHTT
ncbi:MAG: YDG domain-containing protein, partial [Bacteroidia bacterium]